MKLISALVVVFHASVAYALPTPQQQQGFGGGGGGNLGVQCRTERTAAGRYKVNCEGVNQDAIALRSEHILWLQGPAGQQQLVDIVIPNYKVAELIKAGFKQSEGKGTQINVLLKKPEQTYDAQVDEFTPQTGIPQVHLEYEPVKDVLVHFPNDKPYSPLTGPILPPLAPRSGGGGGGPSGNLQSRFFRQAVYPGNKQEQQQPPAPLPNLKNHRINK